MAFPDTCLRGISALDQLEEGISISSSAFNFSDSIRNDGLRDLSVNWHDDEGAVQVLLNQKKANGEIQFKVGYAVIPREELDHLIKQPTVNGLLSYERQQIDNNPYHGNILVRGNLPKPTIRKLQAGLALLVSAVFRRP